MQQPTRKTCRVEIKPRVHVTLIGMNNDGYRHNGGIGFGLSAPGMQLSISLSQKWLIRDTRPSPLHSTELDRLSDTVRTLIQTPCEVHISGQMPSHYGFGSATGTRLALLEATSILTGKIVDANEIVRASGRGSTSGIGVTTYFQGGLVFDAGIKKACRDLLPSSVIEGKRPTPLVISQLPLPDWPVGVCIPFGITRQSEAEEVAFFRRVCPIPQSVVTEALYHVVFGVLASIKEKDFENFCAAIRAIQACAWKKAERELYGESLISIENKLYAFGASAVGMSSLGPGLYYFGKDIEIITEKLKVELPQHQWISTYFSNSPRTLVLS